MTLSEWKDDFKGFVKSLSMPRDDYKGIMEYIDEVPEPHWIPVTERLPEINEDILLSYFDEVTIGWLNSDGSWSIFDGQECVSADEISAWMPLPRAMEFKE